MTSVPPGTTLPRLVGSTVFPMMLSPYGTQTPAHALSTANLHSDTCLLRLIVLSPTHACWSL